MEKKTYKTPVSRVVEFDTDDILNTRIMICSGDMCEEVGVVTGRELGDHYLESDVTYSKGSSWEMDW